MEAGISIKSLLEQAVKQFAKIGDLAILTFPKDKRDAVTITDKDVLSLEPTSSLSSNIVDFYIKYLEVEKLPSNNREQFYFFPSIFFEKLVGTRSAGTDIEYDEVRNMTEEIDLFEKAYIFIPIHEHMHWSLIIIYNLSSLTIPPADEHKGLPRILHLDSDNGSHLLDSNRERHASFLEQRIVRYILSAWTERYRNPSVDQLLAISELRRVEVKVAQLDSEYDSGVYILHLMEFFLEKAASADRVGGFPLESHFTQAFSHKCQWDSAVPVEEPPFTHWDSSEVISKRNEIKNLILKLSGMTHLQFTLRFNYSEILSWLKAEGDPGDTEIQAWRTRLEYDNTASRRECPRLPADYEIRRLEDTALRIQDEDFEQDAVLRIQDEDSECQHEIMSDEEQRVHAVYGLRGESDLIGQHGVEIVQFSEQADGDVASVHFSQQADGEVASCSETHEKHGMKRKNLEEPSEVVRKDAILGGKEKRARAKAWSEEESLCLLTYIAEGNQFLKGNYIDWDLISQEIQKKLGSVRTKKECQGRFDTLTKAYKTATHQRSMSLPAEWCHLLEVHRSRKYLGKRASLTNGGGNGSISCSPCKSPPRSSNDVGTASDPIADSLLKAPTLELDPFQAKVPPGIYQRLIKDKHGITSCCKFEPRLRPREWPSSRRPNYLYLGQYETVEEASAVYQIAAFYYGMSGNVLDLGSGRNFIIPPMQSEESRLSGDEKIQWVKRKVRRVYEEALR